MSADFVVDVGNTRVKWGRCSPQGVGDIVSLRHEPDAWQQQLEAWKIDSPHTWVIAGVRPKVVGQLVDWLAQRGQTARQLTIRDLPLNRAIDVSEKTGLDRLLDAVAVNAVRPAGRAAAIVDAGTAVTVDFVDAHGVFQGGAIFPGIRLMAQALHQYTALLPMVEVKERFDPPGRSTQPAIQAGLFHALLGGVLSLIGVYRRHASGPLAVYCGGGDGQLLASHLGDSVISWPAMTLEGIRLASLAGRSADVP